jgi:hypothetical protein
VEGSTHLERLKVAARTSLAQAGVDPTGPREGSERQQDVANVIHPVEVSCHVESVHAEPQKIEVVAVDRRHTAQVNYEPGQRPVEVTDRQRDLVAAVLRFGSEASVYAHPSYRKAVSPWGTVTWRGIRSARGTTIRMVSMPNPATTFRTPRNRLSCQSQDHWET